ncbi:MAG: phosphodiesterase [Peptococcaceae bacterium]|nr:phosphodiesterase [Peptococcaceae bacterium]
MKIGVISDTHGDAASWRLVMESVFGGADLIIHCGDVLYHGPRNPLVEGYSPQELANLINSCPVPVLFARGNCDADVDQLLLDYPIQAPYAFLQVGQLRIMAHHGDGLERDEMLRLAARYRADLFISGHTHVPVLEDKGQKTAILLNPGSPSLPKAGGRPTVAVLDCRGDSLKIEIINIDDCTSRESLVMSRQAEKLVREK